MNGSEFLKKLKKLGKSKGIEVEFVTERGKGSHGTVYFGDRKATLKDRKKEIGKGLFHKMCDQLGIDPNEL